MTFDWLLAANLRDALLIALALAAGWFAVLIARNALLAWRRDPPPQISIAIVFVWIATGLVLGSLGILVAMLAFPVGLELSETRMTRGAHNWAIGGIGVGMMVLGASFFVPVALYLGVLVRRLTSFLENL